MIKVDGNVAILNGTPPELFDDFTIVMIYLKDILVKEFSEQDALEILSLLGKVAFLDNTAESYKPNKDILYSELASILKKYYEASVEDMNV